MLNETNEVAIWVIDDVSLADVGGGADVNTY